MGLRSWYFTPPEDMINFLEQLEAARESIDSNEMGENALTKQNELLIDQMGGFEIEI